MECETGYFYNFRVIPKLVATRNPFFSCFIIVCCASFRIKLISAHRRGEKSSINIFTRITFGTVNEIFSQSDRLTTRRILLSLINNEIVFRIPNT